MRVTVERPEVYGPSEVYVDGVRVPTLQQDVDASNGYRFVGAWQGGVLKVDFGGSLRHYSQTEREIDYLRNVIADEDLQYFPMLLDSGMTNLGTAWMLTTLEGIDTNDTHKFSDDSTAEFHRLYKQYGFKDMHIYTYLVGAHGAGQRTDGTLVIWDFGQGYPVKVAPKAMHA